MAQMGRPRKEINFDQFEKLCSLQCTEVEIASFFDISVDTLERRVKENYGVTFAEIYKQKAQLGRIAVRRKQFQVAESGNVSMLIWLGKQWLKQSDKIEQKTEISVNDKLVIDLSGKAFDDLQSTSEADFVS